jgi:hypothetical protein
MLYELFQVAKKDGLMSIEPHIEKPKVTYSYILETEQYEVQEDEFFSGQIINGVSCRKHSSTNGVDVPELRGGRIFVCSGHCMDGCRAVPDIQGRVRRPQRRPVCASERCVYDPDGDLGLEIRRLDVIFILNAGYLFV